MINAHYPGFRVDIALPATWKCAHDPDTREL